MYALPYCRYEGVSTSGTVLGFTLAHIVDMKMFPRVTVRNGFNLNQGLHFKQNMVEIEASRAVENEAFLLLKMRPRALLKMKHVLLRMRPVV